MRYIIAWYQQFLFWQINMLQRLINDNEFVDVDY